MPWRNRAWDEEDVVAAVARELRTAGPGGYYRVICRHAADAVRESRPRLLITFQNLHLLVTAGPGKALAAARSRSTELHARSIGPDVVVRRFSHAEHADRIRPPVAWWTDAIIGDKIAARTLDLEYAIPWEHVEQMLSAFAKKKSFIVIPVERPWPSTIELEHGDLRIKFPLEESLLDMVGQARGFDLPLLAVQRAMGAMESGSQVRYPVVRSY